MEKRDDIVGQVTQLTKSIESASKKRGLRSSQGLLSNLDKNTGRCIAKSRGFRNLRAR